MSSFASAVHSRCSRGTVGQGQNTHTPCSVRPSTRLPCRRLAPRRCVMSAAAADAGAEGQHPPPVTEEHTEKERARALEDGEQRAAAAAARHRADPEVAAAVDELLESLPPTEATYVLRLMVHAVDPYEVARDNADAINKEEWFATLRSLLTSQQFKQATSGGSGRAAKVVSVFDSAWWAALEVRQS